jgi:hypothetical protein
LTAATTVGRVPVDEITARARKARPGHVVATLIGGVLFSLAWCVAKLFGVVWFVLAWLYMAVDEGWRSARGTGRPAPDLSALRAENERLRAENARLS